MILFLMLAVLALVMALLVVLNPNPVRSALFLVVNLFCIAGLYLLLNAYFLSAVQVIVYTGAIMVLFLFVIMLLNLGTPDKTPNKLKAQGPLALLSGLLLASALIWAVTKGTQPVIPPLPHTAAPFVQKPVRSGGRTAPMNPPSEADLANQQAQAAHVEKIRAAVLSGEPRRMEGPEPMVGGYPLGSPHGIGLTLYDPKKPWLFPFEMTSILLLIAVIGSVVLARRSYGEEANKS